MDAKITAIAIGLLTITAVPSAIGNHVGEETCILDWIDSEPDELCISVSWNGPITKVTDVPLETVQPPIAYHGPVTLTICLEICVNNLPAYGISPIADTCLAYTAIVLLGGSCDDQGSSPLYRYQEDPDADPQDYLCYQPGRLAIYQYEHESGIGISNVPAGRLFLPNVVDDECPEIPPDQTP